MAITRDKKSIKVFKQIIDDIKIGKFKRGDIIPSEAELCKEYDVGRGSIREALHTLEALGVVRKQAGIGNVIEDFSFESIFNPAGLLFDLDYENLNQVLEFRIIFEQILVKMLPNIITKKDIEKLEEIVALIRFYYDRDDKTKFSEYDYMFHQTLAKSTHNIVIISMFNMIFPFLKIILSQTVNVPENLIDTMKDHEELLEMIKNKKIADAGILIERHIERSRKLLKEIEFKKKERGQIEKEIMQDEGSMHR